MESERAEGTTTERAAVARGQNVLYVLPQDAAAVATFLDPVLARITPGATAAQVLVLTPDDETAVLIAEAATRSPAGAAVHALPVTASRRAARLIRSRAPAMIVGSPVELLALCTESVLKLEGVTQVVIAWADAMSDGTPQAAALTDALAAVLAEVPKESPRTLVTSQLTPAVEALVERYAWRARRAGAVPEADGAPVDLSYVTVAPRARARALRRLFDDLDPECAAVYARSDEAAREVGAMLQALGVADGEASVAVTRGDPVAAATLVVLYESPLDHETLAALGAAGARLVALASPRQLPAWRALAAGGKVTPLTLSGPAAAARSREERLRGDLRTVLAEGIAARELLALEPLLGEYDGIEIAAAALRLFDRRRETAAPAAAAAPVAVAVRPPAGRGERSERAPRSTGPRRGADFAKLYINAGTKDRVSPSDLVGAIANEAGISRDQIGKVDLRETHALVEIAGDVAGKVARAITGVTVKGRRLAARIDDDARAGGASPARGAGFRPRRGDGPSRSDRPRRGDGPPRGGARGPRPPRPRDP